MQFVSVDCATQYSTRQKEQYLCCSHVLHKHYLKVGMHDRFVSHSIVYKSLSKHVLHKVSRTGFMTIYNETVVEILILFSESLYIAVYNTIQCH